MKYVKILYDSAEIEISTFLLLFFRTSGIYVYEKFLDFDKNREASLLTLIDIKNYIPPDVVNDDVRIYIMSQENRNQLCNIINQINQDTGVSLLVFGSETLSEEDKKLLFDNKIEYCEFEKCKVLKEIIEFLYIKRKIDAEEKKDLIKVIECYCKYEIRDLLIVSKFYYKSQENDDFKKFSSKYVNAIKSISTDVFDSNHWHSQYARLYLGYELNMLCKSLDKHFICSKEFIVKKLDDILSTFQSEDNVQIILLLAQTYDDLFSEYNIAYDYYLMACTDMNAFAYYKKGEYWNKYGNKSEQAIKYYEKSVSLFPEYHKAWFNLGVSYLNTGNTRKALAAFENVNSILEKKKKFNNLSEMDIEYLYKSYNLSGYIYYKYYSDYSNAIKYDLLAVDVWKRIDDNIFGIRDESTYSYMKNSERLKKKLDIEKLHHVLYHLMEIIGDKELAFEFSKKIQ